MKNRKNVGVVFIVAVLLILITFMDTYIVFRITSRQTRESGSLQLETISGELESTINEAEKLTMMYAMNAETFLDDYQAMYDYIFLNADELSKDEDPAYNVYIANPAWAVLPGLEHPEEFVPTDRIWYTGARANKGRPYVSAPYVDVVTGNICYSVSVLMSDNETVIAVDYTMENIQAHIAQMYGGGSSNAVIVTNDGIIAGCSNEELIGKRLTDVLPDYAGIFSLAKNKSGVSTARIKADMLYESLFAAHSGNGWVLIVSESDWELYKGSYIQLIITIILSLALFSLIIVLYLLAKKNQKKAENALASKEEFLQGITAELHEPLNRILESSDRESVENTEDYRESFVRIHDAGEKLSEMIGQIVSYSGIVKAGKKKEDEKRANIPGMNRRFRLWIIILLVIVMFISLYENMTATYRWGHEMLMGEAKKYENRLAEWINTQKSILDMYCSFISTNPEILDDYEGTVELLKGITAQYPEISVCYMANPDFEHTVIMNNGWEPESDDWHVEQRPWYLDTEASEEGWSISAPYYDEQTGGYCVTISKKVYNANDGEFLGIFGIDFFMDKLVDILGDSYSDTGYAFLVDPQGDIINHPYGGYQMTQDKKTNVSGLPYGEVKADGKNTIMIRDYDKSVKIVMAKRNEESNFRIYVASGFKEIYGNVVLFSLISLITFIVVMLLVYKMVTNLIVWQDETNRKMKESADAAIAAGKAKSQFLAQVSHEIRTPINAVLGMNEMIIRESEEENILEYSENIKSAGKTLLSIINSILDFSKIEDGKMDIIPVKYDLALMINNLVNSISDRANAKNLKLNVMVDRNLPCALYGDDVRITQIIMNLLTNAVKYTETGSVTLSFDDGGKFDDYIFLDVTVRDTGIGIKEEDMGKLFESFERIEEKRNRNIEGTGLGMAIVTRLLDMMDSKLKVESKYGQGSEFYFRIKQTIVDNTPIGDFEERVDQAYRHTDEEEVLVAENASILVVDDNDMNLKVVRNLLKINGIVPDLSMSGPDAIAHIEKKDYNIVFLDYMMPGMDGVETLKELKKNNLTKPGMYIIALTANAVMGAKEKYLAAGFDDYISKPIEPKNLTDSLKTYLPADMISYKKISEIKKDKKSDPLSGGDYDPSDIPPVNGVDWAYAAKHLPLRELLFEAVSDYRDCIDSQTSRLDEMISRFPDETAVKEYEILIHSIKSISALIGVIPVSGLAKIAEDAACVKDVEKVKKIHGIFKEEYLSYKDKLSEVCALYEGEKEEEKKEFDKDAFMQLLNDLYPAVKDCDIDKADKIVDEIKSYAYPEKMSDKIKDLTAAVIDLDEKTVDKITGELSKGEFYE